MADSIGNADTNAAMTCSHPACTGVHDNSRYHELCPRSRDRKRDKDDRYYASSKGALARTRKQLFFQRNPAAYAAIEEFVTSGELQELVDRAVASGNPVDIIMERYAADITAFLART